MHGGVKIEKIRYSLCPRHYVLANPCIPAQAHPIYNPDGEMNGILDLPSTYTKVHMHTLGM